MSTTTFQAFTWLSRAKTAVQRSLRKIAAPSKTAKPKTRLHSGLSPLQKVRDAVIASTSEWVRPVLKLANFIDDKSLNEELNKLDPSTSEFSSLGRCDANKNIIVKGNLSSRENDLLNTMELLAAKGMLLINGGIHAIQNLIEELGDTEGLHQRITLRFEAIAAAPLAELRGFIQEKSDALDLARNERKTVINGRPKPTMKRLFDNAWVVTSLLFFVSVLESYLNTHSAHVLGGNGMVAMAIAAALAVVIATGAHFLGVWLAHRKLLAEKIVGITASIVAWVSILYLRVGSAVADSDNLVQELIILGLSIVFFMLAVHASRKHAEWSQYWRLSGLIQSLKDQIKDAETQIITINTYIKSQTAEMIANRTQQLNAERRDLEQLLPQASILIESIRQRLQKTWHERCISYRNGYIDQASSCALEIAPYWHTPIPKLFNLLSDDGDDNADGDDTPPTYASDSAKVPKSGRPPFSKNGHEYNPIGFNRRD